MMGVRRLLFSRETLVFSISLALIISVGVDAKPKKKPGQSSQAERTIIFDAALSITYDDNIIRYSEADLGLFDQNALTGKFSIKSKDDWIIVPRISPRIMGRLLGDQISWVDLGFSYYAYTTNDVRRYSRLSLGARQYFTGKLYGEVSYAFIPSYYYRNYQVGTDSAGDLFAEAKFSKHMITAEFGYEISKTLSATAAYKYQHKTYNADFDFRDLNGHGVEIGSAWRPIAPIGFAASYEFERAIARGAEMAVSVLDVSYDSWDILFGIRHYMSILSGIRPELFGSFEVRGTRYQTNRYVHTYYFGREDFYYMPKAGVSLRLPYQIRGTLEYSLIERNSNLPDIYPDSGRVPQTTDELERKLDYNSNSITLRLTRRF
jgi:hypothetical protein